MRRKSALVRVGVEVVGVEVMVGEKVVQSNVNEPCPKVSSEKYP